MGKADGNRYKVDIQGLVNGEHKFDFSIDSRFFELFENSPVEKGALECEILIQKAERLMEVYLTISGNIELECDKSLDLFDYPLAIEKKVIFKYGNEYEELDEHIIQIPEQTDKLDFAKLMYEFIILEIPMKKVHPRYQNDSEFDSMFYSTEGGEIEEDNQDTDPRWSALKDLGKK